MSPTEQLKELKQKIAQECMAELNAVMAKYGCALKAIPVLVDGKVTARIELVVE